MAYKIRRARIKDSLTIYRLGKQIHELEFSKKSPFHQLSEIKEFISKPKSHFVFVAEEDGKIIGILLALILSHPAGGWCLLDILGVDKKSRRKGVGKALLKRLYAELKKTKVWYVQILEEAHHKKTRSFWKKMGFRETKTFIWAEKSVR